ncbi:hypothetical protein [Bdellovibrio sp. HCB337]|uniref:hypothetical protein n=1 Tax=Bdellovibrio sp. HCB337 TaxID=3394358 RepID=UPI0039A76FE8
MAASEDAQVGNIHMSISENCRITFANSQNQKAEWQFPASGPCYFAKDRKGKAKIYQHIKNNSPEAPRLVLTHSSKQISQRDCEGQSVGIVVKDDKVLVSLPPYMKYSMCIGPRDGVDEKNYSYYWFTVLEDGNNSEVSFQ